MLDATFKLDDLATRSGVSARTIRYYVQRGLLPAPLFKGRDTAYGAEHLIRLRAIKALQARFLPLDAIEAELARRSAAELERWVSGDGAPVPLGAPKVPAAPPTAPWRQKTPVVRWERIELAPGLELHLADSMDSHLRAKAQELLDAAKRLGLHQGAPR